MKLVVLLTIVVFAIVACLPTIANEIPEPEARAILQNEVRDICEDRSATVMANVLGSVERATATDTRDVWIFKIDLAGQETEYEALVFRSRVVSGSFITELETGTCR